MLVTDFSGHRIKKLFLTGEFLMKFGTQGSGKGQLNHPWGMCLSSNSNLSVADYSNSRVKAFNPDGTFSNIIKGLGESTL